MPDHQPASATPNLEPPALPPGTHLTTLDNGLVIIVREDHSAPVVSAQAWCATGSIHEGRWLGAGLSHVLEHMLFKGTTTRTGTRIDQEVQEAGGYMNAFTSFDRTVYHIDVPETGWTVAVDILCDIMRNATLPAEELEKEKQVILREMDMNVDDPSRRASRRLFETAYTRNPCRHTIIGYPDIFNELKPEDIVGYYREKYIPNQTFFVVAGDVVPAEVVQRVSAGYAGAKARAIAAVMLPEEPPQTAPREVIEEAPIELGHCHWAWHIPDLRHPDAPALDVLAAILGNGRSSRLYQSVRERQGVAVSVDAWTYSPGGQGLFGVSAVVEPGKFPAAREAVLAEVERVRSEPVAEAEIRKAIKQFVAGSLSARKTMQGQAQDLGACWLAANDLGFSERYLAAARRVTAADLLAVAQRYLLATNRTTYALLPEGQRPATLAAPPAAAEAPVRKIDLPNGLRLLLKEDHRLPFVEYRMVFTGGVLAETVEDSGITQFMARLLPKGTTTRTAEEIATQIESLGGSLDTYGGNNSFGVNAEVMAGDFTTGLELLADVVLNPVFPAAAIEREREIQLAGLRSQRDHLLQSAAKAMRAALFGARGYGLDTSGTEESVGRLGAEALRAFHRRWAVPNNAVLAVYGDIDPAVVQAAVEARFGAWAPGGPGLTTATVEPSGVCREVRHVTELREKKQGVIVIGFRGASLADDDRYPLEILQETCSDLGSRLFLRIREQLGLAYYVGAQNFTGLAAGCFSFYAGTTPADLARVEEEMMAEVALLRSEGISAEELARSKAKILGQRKIARQDLGGVAVSAALEELYGLGYDFGRTEDARYEAVTREQVVAAARKYLTPQALVVAVARPE